MSSDSTAFSRSDLGRHLINEKLRRILAGPLSDLEAARLFHHLPSGCPSCWQQLSAVRPTAADLPPTTSPIVVALRALTTDAPDRLTPLERLARARGPSWHLGFCRLVVDASIRLVCADPDRADVVDVSLLLQLASHGLPREQRHDLFALDHIHETQLCLRAGRMKLARANFKRAMLQYMSGTADPELKATLIATEARMWWARGHRSTAASVLHRAGRALARGGPDLDERRAEILTERAFYLSLNGDLSLGQETLEEALEVLDGFEAPSPRLRLTILHNLATTEANLALAELDGGSFDGLDLDRLRARLDEAADLYKPYGTPSLRAQRDALLSLASGDPGRSQPALYQTLFGFQRSGDRWEAAQVAFELLEWLELRGHRDPADELTEDLRQRLAQSPHLASYFAFVCGRVRELTRLADLPTLPAHLLRARLELLERLTPGPDQAPESRRLRV